MWEHSGKFKNNYTFHLDYIKTPPFFLREEREREVKTKKAPLIKTKWGGNVSNQGV
jgi:hypothetical protein